jgi:predicted glycoside hydrolase/deacetylase ChbG (UPF0249 family)
MPQTLSDRHLLIVDDWGLSPGVNRGILHLARKGVVRRVSILPNMRHTATFLADLLELSGVQLGLHFNVTLGPALPSKEGLLTRPGTGGHPEYRPGFGRLFRLWFHSRDRLRPEIHAAFIAQLEHLRSLGVDPKHFDSHQHVHILPGFLDSVASPLQSSGIDSVRLPYDRRLWRGSRAGLNVLSLLARPYFKRLGLRWHPFFYPEAADFRQPERLRRSLTNLPGPFEVLFHPAQEDDVKAVWPSDDYPGSRVEEFRFLDSL